MVSHPNSETDNSIMETMANPTAGTNEMSGTVGRKMDQATSGIHNAIDKASDAARPAVDRVAASAHRSVDRIAGAATRAAETLDVQGGQLTDAQSRLTGSCSAYVRANPITSVGLAIAGGFLLSRLLSSR